MTLSANGSAAPVVSSTAWPSAVLVAGGLMVLWAIVLKTDSITGNRARLLGRIFVGSAALCFAAALVLHVISQHARCGAGDLAGAAQADLTVLAMALFMLGTAWRTGSEWIAMAAIVVVDLALVWFLLGLDVAHRGEYLDILAVHAVCTAIATYWSRAARGAPRHLRAKASEAGRILASGWIIIVAVGFAGLGEHNGVDTFLTDTTWIGLFIAGAIAAVLGTGYTKYVEVRCETVTLDAPPADLLTHSGRGLTRVGVSLRAWHTAYRDCF